MQEENGTTEEKDCQRGYEEKEEGETEEYKEKEHGRGEEGPEVVVVEEKHRYRATSRRNLPVSQNDWTKEGKRSVEIESKMGQLGTVG